MSIKEWGIIASIVISIISISLVVYKDFLQGSNLKTVINAITFLKLAEENKNEILLNIILDDLLSGRPTVQAQQLITDSAIINQSVQENNREKLKQSILDYSQLLVSAGTMITYDPNEDDIKKHIGNELFAMSFYIPLNIVNSGRKTGDITSLFMKITSKSDKKKQWVYSCLSEINPDNFILNGKQPLGKLIGNIFPGISISPNNNERIDAFLIPMPRANNKIVSNGRLTSGSYHIQMIGYNSLDKKCLQSNIGSLEIKDKLFVETFKGTHTMRNLTLENHIEKEI